MTFIHLRDLNGQAKANAFRPDLCYIGGLILSQSIGCLNILSSACELKRECQYFHVHGGLIPEFPLEYSLMEQLHHQIMHGETPRFHDQLVVSNTLEYQKQSLMRNCKYSTEDRSQNLLEKTFYGVTCRTSHMISFFGPTKGVILRCFPSQIQTCVHKTLSITNIIADQSYREATTTQIQTITTLSRVNRRDSYQA